MTPSPGAFDWEQESQRVALAFGVKELTHKRGSSFRPDCIDSDGRDESGNFIHWASKRNDGKPFIISLGPVYDNPDVWFYTYGAEGIKIHLIGSEFQGRDFLMLKGLVKLGHSAEAKFAEESGVTISAHERLEWHKQHKQALRARGLEGER